MEEEYITPDFVIELNDDYTISNHGIHKNVCSYYRKKQQSDPLQSGGFIRGGTVFAENSRKYFTPSALKYLEKYNMAPGDILSAISNSYNPEYYNSNRMNDLNDYLLQSGGKSGKILDDVILEEDYSGDKTTTRLVYLIRFKDKTVVTKIGRGTAQFLVEKNIYKYFNERTKDLVVKNHILRTYDTRQFPNEFLEKPNPYILLPCKINGKKYKLKLSNDNIPVNSENQPFLTSKKNKIKGVYNYIKSKSKYDTCLYIILEVKPKYFILKDYVKDVDADPGITKRIFYKTINLLNYLNNMYGFNHWDLHYHNLMVYVSPKNKNGKIISDKKRTIDIRFFDFDLSAVGRDNTNTDAYLDRLERYIEDNHNLYESYKTMLNKTNMSKESDTYIKELFEMFENFVNTPEYINYNLDKLIDEKYETDKKLEIYFRYMGKIHDIIRMVNNINHISGIKVSEKDLQNKRKRSNISETKTNIECIIIFNLMKYIKLTDHEKLAYGSILFTDFLLHLRKTRAI